MQVVKASCESCGAPVEIVGTSSFCRFCQAPLTYARRKAVNRTRGKIADVFSNVSPRDVAPPEAVAARRERRNRRKALVVDRNAPRTCAGCGHGDIGPAMLFCPKCVPPAAARSRSFLFLTFPSFVQVRQRRPRRRRGGGHLLRTLWKRQGPVQDARQTMLRQVRTRQRGCPGCAQV